MFRTDAPAMYNIVRLYEKPLPADFPAASCSSHQIHTSTPRVTVANTSTSNIHVSPVNSVAESPEVSYGYETFYEKASMNSNHTESSADLSTNIVTLIPESNFSTPKSTVSSRISLKRNNSVHANNIHLTPVRTNKIVRITPESSN